MNNYRPDFNDPNFEAFHRRRQSSRVFFGIVLVIVGVLLLLRMAHLVYWLNIDLTWPVIMIAVGVILGIKCQFRRNAWWILIVVGILNLMPERMIYGRPSADYVWPLMIVIVGIVIALRPRGAYRFRDRRFAFAKVINPEGSINIDVSFGGKKEVVTSKDFKGGTVNVAFGGVELNLVQADFQGTDVVLEMNVSFSGAEIVIPAHWELKNEINPSFGSVEDKRYLQTQPTGETRKTLILRGACSFGGIEIKSY